MAEQGGFSYVTKRAEVYPGLAQTSKIEKFITEKAVNFCCDSLHLTILSILEVLGES